MALTVLALMVFEASLAASATGQEIQNDQDRQWHTDDPKERPDCSITHGTKLLTN
jgi:hypothetical protein